MRRWRQGNGQPFLKQLSETQLEAARLIISDIDSHQPIKRSASAMPPGYKREMFRAPRFNTDERDVYQLESGQLISIDNKSRMIPLSR